MGCHCKRYIAFGGADGRPNNGWEAYQGTYESYTNAEFQLKERMRNFKGENPWGHIVDTQMGTIVKITDKEYLL